MNISPITRKIMERIGIVAIIIIAGSFILLFFTSFTINTILLFSLGVLITSALNCFKIFMIERTALKVSDMDNPDVGKGYTYFQYILRYFLTIIVVGLVILIMYLITGQSPFLSFEYGRSTLYDPIIIGLVVGLFTLKIAIITSAKSLSEDCNK